MPNYKEIIIDWFNEEDINEEVISKYVKDKYLYCVYCDSHLYGRDVLAYIGQTNNYKLRQYQHTRSYFQFAQNERFVIGFFSKDDFNLSTPESILIANHKPFYNKQYIHDLAPDAKLSRIIVINNESHGSLKTAVTNFWWVDNLGNVDITDVEVFKEIAAEAEESEQ